MSPHQVSNWLILTGLVLLSYACAHTPRTVEPGHRVRVERVEGDTLVGSVVEAGADSLIVRRPADELVRMSSESVRSIEVDVLSVHPWHRPMYCAMAGIFAVGTGLGASSEGWSLRVAVQGILAGLAAWDCADGRPEWRTGRLGKDAREP